MLYRLQVVAGSVDTRSRTFQARGGAPEMDGNEAQRLAKELESGAVARFYRGAPPAGRVVAARATADGVWMKIRINPRQADPWRLVESGAVSTVEIQTLDAGVDLFLKSSPSTYPSLTS